MEVILLEVGNHLFPNTNKNSRNWSENCAIYNGNNTLSLPSPEPRVKRSSSLRVQNELGENEVDSRVKKLVRFADCLGLDLVDIKVFLGDEIPRVPDCAFNDLAPEIEIVPIHNNQSTPVMTILPTFQQPIALPVFTFRQRLEQQKVLLESCSPKENGLIGQITVLNVSYHKSVYVRFTYDEWVSWGEVETTHNPCLHTSTTDTFNFILPLRRPVDYGSFVFAVRFETGGQEFWDNNYGADYKIVVQNGK